MNFEYMPELHSQRGYFMVLLVMAVVALGMLCYFRWRGWIGSGARGDRS
jgi:magnesium transporter